MEILIELYGIDVANGAVASLQQEHPAMHYDYYVRNAFRILD